MFSIKKESKKIKIILISLSILMTLICIITVVKHGNYMFLGSLEKMNNDDVKYIRSAWTLLDKGIFTYQNTTQSSNFIMPGHIYILACCMGIFGKILGIVAFRILQCIIQGISLMLIFFIARKLFNSKIAIITCILDFLYLPEYMASGLILTEVEFKFSILLLIYLSLYALETNQIKYYIEAGIMWSISCLFRPTIVLYPLVILIFWIMYKYKFKDMMKYTFIVSLIFVIIMSPWWIRNYRVFNRFIPLTESSGTPFLQGTYINYHYSGKHLEKQPNIKGLTSNQIQLARGKENLKENFYKNPIGYIYWYTLGKTWFLWEGAFYWKSIWNIPQILVQVYHALIMILVAIALINSFRKKIKSSYFILVIMLYFTAVYVPFYTCERYSYPIMSIVMIMSAYQINKLGERKLDIFKPKCNFKNKIHIK